MAKPGYFLAVAFSVTGGNPPPTFFKKKVGKETFKIFPRISLSFYAKVFSIQGIIASPAKWVASKYAPDTFTKSKQDALFLDGFYHITGAGWLITASA